MRRCAEGESRQAVDSVSTGESIPRRMRLPYIGGERKREERMGDPRERAGGGHNATEKLIHRASKTMRALASFVLP